MNISVTADTRRADALLSRAPTSISTAMRGGMEDSTTYTLAIIKRYPEEPPNSTYTRTHTLEKSWSRRFEGSGLTIRGIVGSNGNMAPYNRRVQDRDRQARIHRGRWQTIQSVAEDITPRVQRFFDDRIRASGLDR